MIEGLDKSIHLSVVTPIFGCSDTLFELYERLKNTLTKITQDFEIVMINDSSPDNAWEIITNLAVKDKRVKGINLSRNFGQHCAITAGLDFVKGDWVVVMDGDLQDTPEEIEKLYNKTKEGFDIVIADRAIRMDSFFKIFSSKIFYIIFNNITNTKLNHKSANFGIYSKLVIANFKKFREQNRIFPFFINWMGFKSTYIEIKHSKRESGKTSYTFSKRFHLGIDSIIAQSNKPLKYSIKFGFFLSFFSLLGGCAVIYRYFFYGIPIVGWTSVIVSIYFVGGLLFANIGVLGLYLGRVFDETKNRPLYIIKDCLNLK